LTEQRPIDLLEVVVRMFVFSKPESVMTNQSQITIIETAAAFAFSEPEMVITAQSQQFMTPGVAKDKCKTFLANLLLLTRDRCEESVARNVRALIQSLIDGKVEPKVFHSKLQKELNSSPQPTLVHFHVHFLKKGLPYLQHSLATKELSIEGVLPPTINQVCQNSKADACQTFQDILFKSRTVEMNKEIEEKNETFKKLEKQKILIVKKIAELEKRQYTNTTEYENRKGRTQKETKIMCEEIEKAKIALANKEKMRDYAIKRQLLDGQQTEYENNKIKQEIGNLKREKIAIEKEQDDLPKKQRFNEDLMKHITNMIDAKMKDLECPVCFYTAEGFIYQCTGGHLICKECLPSLKLCPECRTEYPKSPFRNRFAEKIDEEIKTLSKERKELLDGI